MLNIFPVEITAHSQPSHPLMKLLLICLNSSICCAPALKRVTGRYDCSEDLLDDRRGSLKFITPLDVSFEKSTKYWFSMTIEILTSPNLRNWNSMSVRNPKFLSVSSLNTFGRYFESHWRETWRHTGTRDASPISMETPSPPCFLLTSHKKYRGRASGPSLCAFPVGAWNSLDLYCVPFVTNKKTWEHCN